MSAKWIASLSSGEIVVEDKFNLDEPNLNLSPWLRLINHCRDNGKFITSLRLVINGINYHAPSRGKEQKFFNDITPKRYWACRKVFFEMGSGSNQGGNLISISWISGNLRYFIWVDEVTNNQWIEIKDLNYSLEETIKEYYKESD